MAALMGGVIVLHASRGGLPAAQTSAVPAPSHSFDDQGSFAISFGGHPLGTEVFQIRFFPDKIDAKAEIQLKVEQGGQIAVVQANPVLVLNAQFEPQTYTLIQKGSQPFELSVDFRSAPAQSRLRLTGSKADDHRDFTLPKDVLVLDDNVVHHYQLLIDRFVSKPGKKQTFNAYVPQEAAPGALILEDTGTGEVEIAGRKETLRLLVLSTEMAQIDLWVDAQQHLRRVYNPLAQLEAVREK